MYKPHKLKIIEASLTWQHPEPHRLRVTYQIDGDQLIQVIDVKTRTSKDGLYTVITPTKEALCTPQN